MQPYKKAIFALALSAFCLGVTEFVMAGVLVDVQKYFQIDAKTAGWLTTLYAIGVFIGAPLFTIPLSRFNRHIQLLINMGIFTLANLVVFLSPNFYLTAFARFVAGTQHGVFFVIATLAITAIAPPAQRSTALAIMVTGLTAALVSGVPLGTFIGHYFGFQAIFLLIIILTLFALLGIFRLMPKNLSPNAMSLKSLIPAFSHKNLLKTYLITTCTCGAQFVLYTYIQKLLIDVSGFNASSTAYILLVYGICALIGNLIGGKLVDKIGAVLSLRIILITQVALFLCVSFTMYFKILIIINLALIGAITFASISALKAMGLHKAKRHANAYVDSVISVNEASFNVGIALASYLGGLVLLYFGIEFNGVFAALFALPALFFAVIFARDKFDFQSLKRKK